MLKLDLFQFIFSFWDGMNANPKIDYILKRYKRGEKQAS